MDGLTNTIALHNQLNPSGKHTLTLGDLYSRGGGEGGRTPFETDWSFSEPLPISPSTFRGLIPEGEWASAEDTLSRTR